MRKGINMKISELNNYKAKPFVKWAAGKTQLLNELEKQLPFKIKKTKIIKKYL